MMMTTLHKASFSRGEQDTPSSSVTRFISLKSSAPEDTLTCRLEIGSLRGVFGIFINSRFLGSVSGSYSSLGYSNGRSNFISEGFFDVHKDKMTVMRVYGT